MGHEKRYDNFIPDMRDASSCQRKDRYPTKAIARAFRDRIRREGGGDLFVYECKFCRGFHLTHMSRETFRRRRRNQNREAA
jgi:hypothetical protein